MGGYASRPPPQWGQTVSYRAVNLASTLYQIIVAGLKIAIKGWYKKMLLFQTKRKDEEVRSKILSKQIEDWIQILNDFL